MARKAKYDYFEFFASMMGCAEKSVQYLHTVLGDYQPSRLEAYRSEMHALEHQGDQMKHEMMNHLMKEFLPPIDREDIVRIAHLLDELCDLTEEVVLQLYMWDVHQCRADVTAFTDLLVRQCVELNTLFAEFARFKKSTNLKDQIVKINSLEEEGDRLYLEAVRTLHTDGTELKDQLSWKDIYARLENCCDTCEKISDAVEEVLIKNA